MRVYDEEERQIIDKILHGKGYAFSKRCSKNCKNDDSSTLKYTDDISLFVSYRDAQSGLKERQPIMQPIRQIINDAPPTFQLPVELHHKRVEIIIWPLYEQATPGPQSFKSLLMKMPNVGSDSDFSRQRDFGRGGETWDF